MASRWVYGAAVVALLSAGAATAREAAGRPAPTGRASLAAVVAAYEQATQGSAEAVEGGAGGWTLPDTTPAAEAGRLKAYRAVRERVATVDRASLGEEDQLTYDLLVWTLDDRIEAAGYDEARMPFSSDGGFDVDLLYRANGTRLQSEADAKGWLGLLRGIPAYYETNIDNARRGLRTRFVQPAVTADGVLARARRSAATPVAQDPLLEPLRRLPQTIPAATRAALLKEGEGLIASRVAPARQAFVAFMADEYLPGAGKSLAASDLPDGRAYYAFLVRHHTTTRLTPDEVHELGLREVARIRAEMERAKADAGFTGTMAEFRAFLRQDDRFYATTRQQLLEKASEIAKRVDDQLPAHFRTLPRLSYGVRPVPASIEEGYTTGRYFQGDPREGLAGGLMINTSSLRERPLYELPALVMHEGAPGHHVQVALAQEQVEVPAFRRDLYVNAFGEGWGLYSERLGEEMGIYRDPYERFGRLSYEMWRACRLVADTGIHWKGWSIERARACFTENTALSPVNIEVELQRYVSWPGQALAYKIGELKLIDLRERAERTLGERFDERDFHDAVLLHGSLPLDVLERRIDAWIAARKAAAPAA